MQPSLTPTKLISLGLDISRNNLTNNSSPKMSPRWAAAQEIRWLDVLESSLSYLPVISVSDPVNLSLALCRKTESSWDAMAGWAPHAYSVVLTSFPNKRYLMLICATITNLKNILQAALLPETWQRCCNLVYIEVCMTCRQPYISHVLSIW